MGQIKNIKLHIVTDIKIRRKPIYLDNAEQKQMHETENFNTEPNSSKKNNT